MTAPDVVEDYRLVTVATRSGFTEWLLLDDGPVLVASVDLGDED